MMSNLPKKWIITGILFTVVLIGSIIGWRLLNRAPDDAAWEHAQQTGVIRVGMDAAYPPFEWINETNELVGFDVDLANEIGKRLGMRVEFINIAYDGLFDALLTGRVDMLVSGLVDAREFWGKADFSIPYFNIGEHLVVQDGTEISQMEELVGRTVAVEVGSGGDVEARKWQRRLAELNVVRYPDANAALDAVLTGEADAALVDGITARLGVGQHPDLVIADNVVDTLIAAAVHLESNVLAERVDAALNEMAEDGTLEALVNEWFGAQN
jgi:ABC-type amino acid transport substrate-binding protein